MKEYISAVIDG